MKEATTTLQKSKEDEAIQKREAMRTCGLAEQVDWLVSGGLDKNDEDGLIEANKYFEESNLPMTTEDRLRELAPHCMTRSSKFRPKDGGGITRGGGVLEMRLVIQESIEILTLYLHAFII